MRPADDAAARLAEVASDHQGYVIPLADDIRAVLDHRAALAAENERIARVFSEDNTRLANQNDALAAELDRLKARIAALCEAQGAESYVMVYVLRNLLGGSDE